MLSSRGSRCMRNVALRDTAFQPKAVVLLQLPPCCSVCVAPSASLPHSKTYAHHDGALLLSAWLEHFLRLHHCRVKDWRYSQAAM